MDESAVQTALCVIGHPIAGNPSQFCILRALAALGLEWQCLSFDVPPASLPAAVSGIDVLGFAGALIAAPHHGTAAALLQPAADDTAPPSPAPPSPAPPSSASPDAPPVWIDGLQRGADDRWVGCNFLGEAFAELLAGHQRKLAQPLPHCIFLGDAETFTAAVVPYQQHLPASRFTLDPSGLRRLPSSDEPAPPAEPAAAAAAVTPAPAAAAADAPSPPAPQAEAAEPPAAVPPATEANTEPAPVDGAPDAAAHPLDGPVLLIRPHCTGSAATGTTLKKGAGKGSKIDPQWASLVASTLQRLHPDSLLVDLAPEGAPWQVIRGQANGVSAAISPLDLEVHRIAVALRRWTGHDPDRTLLAEAIEEYLEI